MFLLTLVYVVQYTLESEKNFSVINTNNGIVGEKNWKKYRDLEAITLMTFTLNENQEINHNNFTINAVKNEEVEALYIKNNALIEFLPVKVTEIFPNLVVYDASVCRVQSISADNFLNLTKLEELILFGNKIEKIESKTFDDLISLKILSLSSNKIKLISENAFQNLKNLRQLRLDDNKLLAIWFDLSPLAELLEFSISSNNISILQQNIFLHNKKLEYLWFRKNKIEFIFHDVFDHLQELQYINLIENICINETFYRKNISEMKNDEEFVHENHNLKSGKLDKNICVSKKFQHTFFDNMQHQNYFIQYILYENYSKNLSNTGEEVCFNINFNLKTFDEFKNKIKSNC